MNIFHTDGCGKCPFLHVDHHVDHEDNWCCNLGYPLYGSMRKDIRIDSAIVQNGPAFPDDCPLPVTIDKDGNTCS